MGAIEQNIAKQAYNLGKEMPDRIKNAPILRPDLQMFLGAYFELDTERTHSFGLTPIPWSSIKKYAESYDFDEELTEDFIFLIRKMDDENLKVLKKKHP